MERTIESSMFQSISSLSSRQNIFRVYGLHILFNSFKNYLKNYKLNLSITSLCRNSFHQFVCNYPNRTQVDKFCALAKMTITWNKSSAGYYPNTCLGRYCNLNCLPLNKEYIFPVIANQHNILQIFLIVHITIFNNQDVFVFTCAVIISVQ